VHLQAFCGDLILHVRYPILGHGSGVGVQAPVIVNFVAFVHKCSGNYGVYRNGSKIIENIGIVLRLYPEELVFNTIQVESEIRKVLLKYGHPS
jgi:hypothetical protein